MEPNSTGEQRAALQAAEADSISAGSTKLARFIQLDRIPRYERGNGVRIAYRVRTRRGVRPSPIPCHGIDRQSKSGRVRQSYALVR
jgi:hypothetical protein